MRYRKNGNKKSPVRGSVADKRREKMDSKKFDDLFMKEATKSMNEALVRICHVQRSNVEELGPVILECAKAYCKAMEQRDEILV